MTRIDKWIWSVRMVKSRTLAGALCAAGKVWVNGEKVKASKNIKIEDEVIVEQKEVVKHYQVTGLIEKRVGAEIAAQNYIDLTPEVEVDPEAAWQENPRRAKGEGRPTKKEYRDMQDFLGKN